MRRDSTLLTVITVTLILIGLVMIYSIGAVRDPYAKIFLKHLAYLCVGMIGFACMVYHDYHRFGRPRMLRLVVFASLLLLALTFIPPFRLTMNGAPRWIGMGPVSFQPSEFAKFALVLLLAVRLTQHQEKILNFGTGFVMPFALAGVFVSIILMQKDIGIPFVMLATTFILVWVAGGRKLYLFLCSILCFIGGCVLISMYSYRMERIMALGDPFKYRDTIGYHLTQSLSAFAQGGFWGRGAGAGEQKLGYLPAAHTDFIFAMLGEEFGLIGTITTVLLFLGMLYIALRIAANAPDLFGFLLATGITMLLLVQAAFIMAVNLGLAPTKGLPLPFVSYGGSALIVSLSMMGILVNIGIQGELAQSENRAGIAPKALRPPVSSSRPRLTPTFRVKA